MTRDAWVRQEIQNPLHWMAVLGFGALLFLAASFLIHGKLVWLAYGVFFLFTAWPLLKFMIVITLILSAAVTLFPPLAPFVLVLMAIFFILRIRFVWKHRWPMLFGLLFYGAGAVIGLEPRGIAVLSRALFSLWGLPGFYAGALATAVIGAGILHLMLRFLYGRGYSARDALGLMGSVPLIILAFILPFLKIAGAEGFLGDTVTFHDAMPTGDMPAPAPDPLPDAPLHHVDGYVRSGPSGPVYVQSHWQTNPDAFLENNLSYQGISIVTHETAPVGTAVTGESAPTGPGIYPGDTALGTSKKKETADHEKETK